MYSALLGNEALAARASFALVVDYVHMPGMDGLEISIASCSMMTPGPDSSSPEKQIAARPPRCPFLPHATIVNHTSALVAPDAGFFAGTVHHPAIFSSIEAKRRISASRSHQKRGPAAAV